LQEAKTMSAISSSPESPIDQLVQLDTTLLDLVYALSEVTQDEREIIATVFELLRSGRVRLTGNFRGAFELTN
jgi:hypothetical protein